MLRLASEAFNAGDLDGLAALYEPEATLVPQPGQAVSGSQAIREALRGFVAVTQAFDVNVKTIVHGSDVALVHSDWSLHGAAPNGCPVEMRGSAADVVRRQPDGTWLLAIDNPVGRRLTTRGSPRPGRHDRAFQGLRRRPWGGARLVWAVRHHYSPSPAELPPPIPGCPYTG